MRAQLLLPTLLLLAACEAKQTSTAAAGADSPAAVADNGGARAAIDSMRNAWKAAADRKDAETVAGMYADDAVMAGGQAPAASGRSEIQGNLTQMFAAGTVESIDSKEVEVAGDLAYDYGTYQLRLTPPNQPPQTVTGYYVVVFRRQSDGTWKITRHIDAVPPPKA